MAALLACTAPEPAPVKAGGDTGTGAGTPSGDDGGGGTGGGDNRPPTTPVPTSPADEAVDVAIEVPLCWEASTDPDGDPIRYKVVLNDVELGGGILYGDGFDDTCTTPLLLDHDAAYDWYVVAFDPDDPAVESDPSARVSFRTVVDPEAQILFEDDFTDDLGWTVLGDAATGAWVRGDPVEVEYDELPGSPVLAQPGTCHGGNACYFTGQNPDGDPTVEDVDGGTTTLLSPPFDMTGLGGVTVSLARFFYRSDFDDVGNALQIELVVPDTASPDGFRPFVLEQVDNDEVAKGANLWTPVAFSACGIPFVEDARLRISATDRSNEIVEAAIDSVVVTGHASMDACTDGAGALCDPQAADPCGPDLLCCPQHVLNDGVYRCAEPARALDPDDPGDGPDAPLTGPLGCDAPDLRIRDHDVDMFIEDVWIAPESCSAYEGCVADTGWRRLLRFDANVQNVGAKDLALGFPADRPDLFHFSDCHGHYHFDGFATYALLDGTDEVGWGHKQAYCVLDWRSFAWPDLRGAEVDGDDGQFYCYSQGLSVGFEDEYSAEVDCQWVDITDVAPGDYTLRIDVNTPVPDTAVPALVERDYTNNRAEIPVTIPPP